MELICEEKKYEKREKELHEVSYFVDKEFKDVIDWKSYFGKGSYPNRQKVANNIKLIDNIANSFNCEFIIDVGCTSLPYLSKLRNKYTVIGIDINIVEKLPDYDDVYYIHCNLEEPIKINLPEKILRKSMIICSNTLEKVENKGYILSNIKDFMEYSKIGLITTLERTISNSEKAVWTINEVKKVLKHYDYNLNFIGLCNGNNKLSRDNILCIIGKNNEKKVLENIGDFRVVAIMAAYNEEDILYDSVCKLKENGIDVYIIENWSSDSTFKIVQRLYRENKIMGFERLPEKGPSMYFQFKEILKRKEQLAREIDADWFIHHDVDEIRRGSWDGLSLKESIYLVDKMGYNAIDYSLINFQPVDNGFIGGDFEEYFKYFTFFDTTPRINTWKKIDRKFDLASCAGHRVNFSNRKIFPFKFLIKHYTYRSQAHGLKKVLQDRNARYSPQEVRVGWHIHHKYLNSETNFLKNIEECILYDERSFREYFLLEKLFKENVFDAI